VVQDNCYRCLKRIKAGFYCDACEQQNKVRGKKRELLAQQEYRMWLQDFVNIGTLCPRCRDKSLYMNAKGVLFCPACENEIPPDEIEYIQFCSKCKSDQTVNFMTGATNCQKPECESWAFGFTPYQRLEAAVPKRLEEYSPPSMNASKDRKKQVVSNILLVPLIPFAILWQLIKTPFGIALVIVAFWIFWASTGGNFSSGSVDSSAEAIANCQIEVKSQLSDPGSAGFTSTSAQQSNAGWTVTGMVSARNGFNARVSRVFVCTINGDQIQVAIH
jgi:hypothetical protein